MSKFVRRADTTTLAEHGKSIVDSFEVRGLFIYPIKSCQAQEVSSVKVTKWGPEYDRRWAIVGKEVKDDDTVKWHVESIYEMRPELARIQPVIDFEAMTLTLKAHGFEDHVVPVRTQAGQKNNFFLLPNPNGNPSVDHAEDEGEEAAEWVTRVINKDRPDAKHTYHLVWMPPDVSGKCAAHPAHGHLFNKEEEMSFSNKAQYLVCNEASLDELNDSIQKMGDDPVRMARLRPNMVIRGQPWEEETWKVARVGHGLILRACAARLACTETTVFMKEHNGGWGGERDPHMQPFKALKKFHSGKEGKPRFGLLFNRCFVDSTQDAVIHVGDHFTIVEHEKKNWVDVNMVEKDTETYDMVKPSMSVSTIERIADEIEDVATLAESGDGSLVNVGIKLGGRIPCPNCRQKFVSERALECHWKFIHDVNRHQED